MAEKALTAQEVASKLGPAEFMRLCSKVTTEANQTFSVLEITKVGNVSKVTVELANGKRKTVTL